MAFVFAGITFFGTLVICVLMMAAATMSDSPSAARDIPVGSTFIGGVVLSALLAASHWIPFPSW